MITFEQMERLGALIRARREAQGVSAEWLAQHVGDHEVMIREYEAGVACPNDATLNTIAHLLEIDAASLIGCMQEPNADALVGREVEIVDAPAGHPDIIGRRGKVTSTSENGTVHVKLSELLTLSIPRRFVRPAMPAPWPPCALAGCELEAHGSISRNGATLYACSSEHGNEAIRRLREGPTPERNEKT